MSYQQQSSAFPSGTHGLFQSYMCRPTPTIKPQTPTAVAICSKALIYSPSALGSLQQPGTSSHAFHKHSSLAFTNLLAPSTKHFGSSAGALVVHQVKETKSLSEVLSAAGKKALGGGIPGMAAMGIQVLTLMWLRTTVNYQYRYGTTTMVALRTLYKEGGVRRFYRGLGPALIQGPLSRFGDTAANTGMLALLDSFDNTSTLPVGVKTLCASLAAGAFRIVLMPVDALKTIMQVEGKSGPAALAAKIRTGGVPVLYHGALAASAATFVGHYPWFATYNYLNEYLPKYDDLPKRLLRSAFIGFCASAISDTCSNSIRVIKTTKQTSTTPVTYPEVVKTIVEKEGWLGLFGRGLKTKILSNGMQGLLFSVLWRMGQDYYAKLENESKK